MVNIDDAVTASRAAGGPAVSFSLRVPTEPVMLAQVRGAIGAWLRRLAWPDDESAAIVHAVDEACTNVIDHAYAFDGAGEIELTAHEDRAGLRRHVVITVQDQGRWRQRNSPDSATSGLAIMRALMHRVNVHVHPDGTRVNMVSCAVRDASPRDDALPRRPVARTINRDARDHTTARLRLAFDAAAAQCDRARMLIGSSHAIVQACLARRQGEGHASA